MTFYYKRLADKTYPIQEIEECRNNFLRDKPGQARPVIQIYEK